MPIRTFPKLFTLAVTNTPQPMIFTTFGASTIPSGPAPFPGGGQPPVVISVGASGDESIFLDGDKVWLSPGTANAELADVVSIDTTGHTISCICQNAHTSGDFIQLAVPIAEFYLQPLDGNTAAIFIGNKSNMSTTAWTVQKLQNVSSGQQPIDTTTGQFWGANPLSTGELWVYGTNPDKYRVSLQQG